MFANVVLIAFLLISAVVFVFLFLLIRQIRLNGSLPPEKLSTLTALLFIPAIVVFGLLFYGLTSWRSDIKNEQIRLEIDQFVRGVYEPLADSQQSLLESIAQMESSLAQYDDYYRDYPNHQGLLKVVEAEWQRRYDELTQLHGATDKDIRHAWILYRTMNRQDVHDKFHTRAVQQNDRIRKVEQNYYSSVRGVRKILLESLDQAHKVLAGKIAVSLFETQYEPATTGESKTDKHAGNQKKTRTLPIRAFSEQVSTRLLDMLARLDPDMSKAVELIRKDVLIARQRYAEVELYLDDNPDLEQPLKTVLSSWRNLEKSNQLALNRILYALEAEYLALALGLPQNHSALDALHSRLATKIPQLLDQAHSERAVLERSYSIR